MKTTTMKLTFLQRLQLPQILPEIGRLDIGRACKDIREKVWPTQEEFKEAKFEQTNLGVIAPNNFQKEITFTELEIEAIQIGFKAAEKAERLPISPGWIELYDIVCEDKKEN